LSRMRARGSMCRQPSFFKRTPSWKDSRSASNTSPWMIFLRFLADDRICSGEKFARACQNLIVIKCQRRQFRERMPADLGGIIARAGVDLAGLHVTNEDNADRSAAWIAPRVAKGA